MLLANNPVTFYMLWNDQDDNALAWMEKAEFVPGEIHCGAG